MTRALNLLLALMLASAAPAFALDLTLAPAAPELDAGAMFEVDLVATNPDASAASYSPPSLVAITRSSRDGDRTVSLQRADESLSSAEIAAGRFLRVRYRGQMPTDLVGELAFRPANIDANAVAVRSLSATSGSADLARFTSAISANEPMYFSMGSRGNTSAKFQVSLKFRIFNPETKTPFLEKLYLAYSQTSIWDLDSASKPFRDSSYRPGVFFLDDRVSQWPFANSRLGFQSGLEHESNGKDSADSRSINIAYLRPAVTFLLGDGYALTLAPKIYHYLDKDENPDIDDYRGHADFLIRFGQEDGWLFDTTLRRGHSAKSSVQVDASYPLRKPTFGNLGGYLHLQYFNGYGESLVDYDRKLRSQFRIGLMVTRGLRW
jgi:outer membrane phospholipase A